MNVHINLLNTFIANSLCIIDEWRRDIKKIIKIRDVISKLNNADNKKLQKYSLRTDSNNFTHFFNNVMWQNSLKTLKIYSSCCRKYPHHNFDLFSSYENLKVLVYKKANANSYMYLYQTTYFPFRNFILEQIKVNIIYTHWKTSF